MEIVVDTNIIISALLKDGITRRILLLSPFDTYTIVGAQEEIDAHKKELIHKSKITDEQFEYLIQLIFSKMSLISPVDIEPFRDIAMEIMKDIDIDDAPFLALAMNLNSPLWSNDRHLKRQNEVQVFTTREILSLLNIHETDL